MNNIFDYKSSLNGIKANLFDIYENQEQIIGLEQDESKRNKRLNKFIEMKDIALMLLDEIESLYISDIKDEDLDIVKLSNPKLPELEEERYDYLVKRMDDMGVPKEDLYWYINLRKFGGCKHSGFGMGFERLLIYLTGVENIRDVIPYPRTPKNCEF